MSTLKYITTTVNICNVRMSLL